MQEIQAILSGMLGQEQRIAQISNNLANVNTVGFKKQYYEFDDYLKLAEKKAESLGMSQAKESANPSRMVKPAVGSQYTNFAAGELQTTGEPLDMAIEGEGFFQVKNADGAVGYTRAGNFTLNSTGELVTMTGENVLDSSNSPIKLNPTGGKILIGDDGTIQQDKTVIGKVGVVTFDKPQAMMRHGSGQWRVSAEEASAKVVDKPVIRAGTLEGSNVNPISEMVDMIGVQRAYEMNQKAIQSLDDITGKRIQAVN
jgi:flagellar basal-body rod protein FlgF